VRKVPEGAYKIYPVGSQEVSHIGYELAFAPIDKLPYGYRAIGLYPSPEEAAVAAAEHYAELGG